MNNDIINIIIDGSITKSKMFELLGKPKYELIENIFEGYIYENIPGFKFLSISFINDNYHIAQWLLSC